MNCQTDKPQFWNIILKLLYGWADDDDYDNNDNYNNDNEENTKENDKLQRQPWSQT